MHTVLHLHGECDPYGCRVLKRSPEDRNPKSIVQDISLRRKKEPSQYLTKRRRFSFELFVRQQAPSAEPLPPWIQETRKPLCLQNRVWFGAARSATISRRTECLTSRVHILQHRPSQIQCPALSLNPNPRLSGLRESRIGLLSRKLSEYRVTHEGF